MCPDSSKIKSDFPPPPLSVLAMQLRTGVYIKYCGMFCSINHTISGTTVWFKHVPIIALYPCDCLTCYRLVSCTLSHGRENAGLVFKKQYIYFSCRIFLTKLYGEIILSGNSKVLTAVSNIPDKYLPVKIHC